MIKATRSRNATVVRKAEELARRAQVPRATYRLQLNPHCTFADARALTPYLAALGISDVYASPVLQARAGSSHGYDIRDHSRLNEELGGEEGFITWSDTLRAHGLGLIMDMVPNHMAISGPGNAWWHDVLENGPGSAYAGFFDIDWQPERPFLDNKVMTPLLEDQYGRVLEQGKLQLTYDEGAFTIMYYEHRLPLAPASYAMVLALPLEGLRSELGDDSEAFQEYQSILTALGHLPPRTEQDPEQRAVLAREKEVIKRRIAKLAADSAPVRAAIDRTLAAFTGTQDQPEGFDRLHALLDAQAYHLAFWKVAGEEINYRRFFDINDLAAIRTEQPEVFDATHALVLRLIAEERVRGLRIDHVDGLYAPAAYLRRLQERVVLDRLSAADGAVREEQEQAVARWVAAHARERVRGPRAWPLWVVVEKILAAGEPLREDWPVAGETGYAFARACTGLFVDREAEAALDRLYTSFTGNSARYADSVNANKKMIMLIALASEVNALAGQLHRVSSRTRRFRDFTRGSLTFALREVIAALPVYRTYLSPDAAGSGGESAAADRQVIERAIAEARRRNPRTAAALFDFLADTLLLRNLDQFAEEDRTVLVDCVMKFQQVSGPAMAKGVEDTSFYTYNRLVALNEVGGEPAVFGTTVQQFHRENLQRARRHPDTMLTSSTHDTKRGEDVRARICVLSELPGEWRTAVRRWSRLNAPLKGRVDGLPAPDRNDEYLFYQTLVGVWPEGPLTEVGLTALRDRLLAYMHKATNEAKVHTSWFNPNEEYGGALRDFICGALPVSPCDPRVVDFAAFSRRAAFFGYFNALSQTLLKLTAPGVPDIYQGMELWDDSLVDPDNRRLVDFARRTALLTQLQERAAGGNGAPRKLARELVDSAGDGRIKLFVTMRALAYRRDHARLFARGSYLPLRARGPQRNHLVAFARTLGRERIVVAVPRLTARLTGGAERPPLGPELWADTMLTLPKEEAGRCYHDLFTGARLTVTKTAAGAALPVGDMLSDFPVALLHTA